MVRKFYTNQSQKREIKENDMARYKNNIMNAVNRFPLVYKRQAFAMLDEATREATKKALDSAVCAALIVLVQDFGFGTRAGSTQIPKFMACLQRYIDDSIEFFDDAFVDGMKFQLKQYGIEYTSRSRDEVKEDG
jgi:hypothetical protein